GCIKTNRNGNGIRGTGVDFYALGWTVADDLCIKNPFPHIRYKDMFNGKPKTGRKRLEQVMGHGPIGNDFFDLNGYGLSLKHSNDNRKPSFSFNLSQDQGK